MKLTEKLTERARSIVQFAHEEALAEGATSITSLHVVLGCLRERKGLAGSALSGLGLRLDGTRERAAGFSAPKLHEDHPGMGENEDTILQAAYDECRRLSHNYIGTEHLLLACIRHRQTTASQLLTDLGIPSDDVRSRVYCILGKSVPPVE